MQTNLSELRRRAVPLLAGALVALSACGGGGYGGGSSTGGGGVVDPTTLTPVVTTSVSLSGLQFTPGSIQVAPGATITFTNNDGGITHNVTFASSAVTNIGDFSSGSKTTVAPSTAGSYTYQCTHHSGMNGVIKVQ